MDSKPHCTAFIAASIDGRISLSSTKKPDWTSQEDWEFFQASLAQMDAVVVGRNTYKAARERLIKRNTFVLTSQIKSSIQKGSVVFVNPKKVKLKDLLKNYKKVAVVGGNEVYRFMLEEGLLDEIYLTLEPYIFGRGKEMFIHCKKNTSLKLVSSTVLNEKGSLLLHYLVLP